jgi:RES domain-containing protein
LRWVGRGYRAHHPRWAWSPLSGEGAALKGGRFNPRGVPALYLALSVKGMICEMGHGFSRVFEPLTICTYSLDVADVVDLTTDDLRAAVGISLDDMACAWEYEVSEGRRPASWSVHDRLVARAAGIVVPSFARGARADMHNLVLWRWGSDLPQKVEVHDPSGRLPKNQLSWR